MVSASGNYSSRIVPSGLHASFSSFLRSQCYLVNTVDPTRFPGNIPRKLTKGQVLMQTGKSFVTTLPIDTDYVLSLVGFSGFTATHFLFVSCNFLMKLSIYFH